MKRVNEFRCAHCGAFKRIVARGLCLPCYKNPALLVMHPPMRRGARKGDAAHVKRSAVLGLGLKSGSVPQTPTLAVPGSAAKALVMQDRVERGESPHHPLDARDHDGAVGLDAKLSVDYVRLAEVDRQKQIRAMSARRCKVLVVTVELGEKIVINPGRPDQVVVVVERTNNKSRVRVGFEADRSVEILRQKLLDQGKDGGG